MPTETFNKNAQKMERLMSMMDNESLTREEFTKSFQQVLDLVKKLMERNEVALQRIEETYQALLNKAGTDNEGALSDLRKQVDGLFVGEKVSGMEQRVMDAISKIENRMASMHDGMDGMQGERGERGEAGKKPNAIEIQQAVFPLMEAYKEELKKELDEKIKKIPRGTVGGRFGAIGDGHVAQSFGRMFQSATPTGDIDGVNTTYTVPNPINQVISFAINGMVIHDNEYTASGRTITMTTAIPAGLSGTTFRIVYV